MSPERAADLTMLVPLAARLGVLKRALVSTW
jgi:hypothetical protein